MELLGQLYRTLIVPIALTNPPPKSRTIFWLSLSLTFAAIYSLLALQLAFGDDYVVQDDARQHIFWMRRFVDPDLFPNDWIADYFQSVAPDGYTTLYRVIVALGIDPIVVGKLFPLVLSLATTAYGFGLVMELLPVPIAGFITTLLLNQNLWMRDGYASATPRTFLYPIFLAFLYYLLRRSVWGCLGAIALQILFYPAYGLVAAGLLPLRLVRWQAGKFHWSSDRRDYQICIAGLGLTLIMMLLYLTSVSRFAPTITAAEAKTLPDFLSGGRASFFRKNPVKFWLTGSRSGLLPRSLFTPVTLCTGLLLPILLYFPKQFSLVKQLRQITLIPQLLLVGIGWFLVAHAMLFKLHLPSRYTGYTFLLAIVLATGIVLTMMLDAIYQWMQTTQPKTILKSGLAIALITIITSSLLFYPSVAKSFPVTGYLTGTAPHLYQFFTQQPKDIVIASLSSEANNLPTFAQRSILVGSEYAVPYHVGYYQEFQQRASNLIRAQYSSDLNTVKQFIQQYRINFWVLEPEAFEPNYLSNNSWINQYQPAATEAVESLEQGHIPVLQQMLTGCPVLDLDHFAVIDTRCIQNFSSLKPIRP
ncbi:hypothetical protein ACN4EK_08105 [Pantanalinema rosaneae CENA516]|uniref:hypothetical protein n=1 Tax=Pantanalinema rosaneae TaxID=1620701 RepID=UPI003D6FA426